MLGKILVMILWCIVLGTVDPLVELNAQNSVEPGTVKKTPANIEFTSQMSRAKKDLVWSRTYFNSYQMTTEVSYLKLSAGFCLKSINRLAETLKQLSRTTKFYNMADQKRLQACQYYDILQRKSFLLLPKYHLNNPGASCQ
jgi:predicted secreted protein